jgi:hypothetical protein
MHGCIWRVLSVANLLHKPVGISATSGCPWGCKGLWTSKAPCPVWFGESCVATCFRARARDGELALMHGGIYTTTLRRWHSGYHGFKPKLTNKLALSCQLNCSPSPAVQMGRKPECREGQDVRERPFRTGYPVTWRELRSNMLSSASHG